MGYVLMAFAAGAAVALQGVINSQLRPMWGLVPAVVLNMVVSSVPILLYWVVQGAPTPSRAQLAETPPILWIGGLCGLFIVISGALVFTRLGATTALGLILAGQFVVAALVDHYGWLGMPQQSFNVSRAAGLLLLGLAVWLFRR